MYIEEKRQTENKEYLTVIAFQYVKIATEKIRKVADILHKRNCRTMCLTRDGITQWFVLVWFLFGMAKQLHISLSVCSSLFSKCLTPRLRSNIRVGPSNSKLH